jgi:hypothetical protein
MQTNADSTQPVSSESALQSTQKRIAVFFYGSFIRREVMARANFHPHSIEIAKLSGFDINFDPHANIFRSDQHAICGILVYPSHEDLHRLYSMDRVGVFLPEAVLVETQNSKLQPAMCYMPPARGNQPADLDYLEHIISAAREYGFPAWYVERLESFR